MVPYVCKGCGGTFQGWPYEQRQYCSQDCRNESLRVLKTCAQCGVPFKAQRHRAERTRFCGKACFDAFQTTSVATACEVCGKATERVPSRAGAHHYCSLECSYQGRSTTRRKNVTLTCAECGTAFERPRYWSQRSRTFCSKACYGKMLSRTNKAAGHNRRRLALFSDARGPNWRTQVKHAKRRDGYRCRQCGSVERLEVHHIRPYRLFDGDYKAANTLANLITLCVHCHRQAEVELHDAASQKTQAPVTGRSP